MFLYLSTYLSFISYIFIYRELNIYIILSFVEIFFQIPSATTKNAQKKVI